MSRIEDLRRGAGTARELFWATAAERTRVGLARAIGEPPPWTSDEVLRRNRFTNVYRLLDRATQYLVRRVIDGQDCSPRDTAARTLLYCTFNKPETWEQIELEVGPVSARTPAADVCRALRAIAARGWSLYTGAYKTICCFPGKPQYQGHVETALSLASDVPERGFSCEFGQEECQRWLVARRGVGPFFKFQLAIALSYGNAVKWTDADMRAVPGPGAIAGASRITGRSGAEQARALIADLAARAPTEPAELGHPMHRLVGRGPSEVDVEHWLCEFDKYCRAAAGQPIRKREFDESAAQKIETQVIPRKLGGGRAWMSEEK